MSESPTIVDIRLPLPDGVHAHVRRADAAGSAAGSPKSAVIVLHGIQSHGGWYEGLLKSLAANGRLAVLPDRRGSGQSEGERGHADSAQQLIDDVHAVSGWLVNELDSKTPIDLVGISWGGLPATAAFRDAIVDAKPSKPRFRSLTLVTPGFVPKRAPSIWQKLRMGTRYFTGSGHVHYPIPLGEPSLFTEDPDWQRFIADDTLSLRTASASLFGQTHYLGKRARPLFCEDRDSPILLLLAERDAIIDTEAVRAMITIHPNATAHRFPAAHTLEFSEQCEAYHAAIANFLNELDGKPTPVLA